MEDDLSSLLSERLTLWNGSGSPSRSLQNSGSFPDHGVEQPIKYFISQHYNHSAHLASSGSHSDIPAQFSGVTGTDQTAAEIILARNGLDPSALFPSQLELFMRADVSQQMRLIELWRTAPSDYGAQAYALEFRQLPPSHFMQEGISTISRGEHQMEEYERQGPPATDVTGRREAQMGMMVDGDGINQGSVSSMDGITRRGEFLSTPAAEPYIVSGYEDLAKREYEDQVAEQQWRHQQHQHQQPGFSPLGSAVSQLQEMARQNHALGPVDQRIAYLGEQHEGQGSIAYQYGVVQGPASHKREILGGSQIAPEEEDEEML